MLEDAQCLHLSLPHDPCTGRPLASPQPPALLPASSCLLPLSLRALAQVSRPCYTSFRSKITTDRLFGQSATRFFKQCDAWVAKVGKEQATHALLHSGGRQTSRCAAANCQVACHVIPSIRQHTPALLPGCLQLPPPPAPPAGRLAAARQARQGGRAVHQAGYDQAHHPAHRLRHRPGDQARPRAGCCGPCGGAGCDRGRRGRHC